MSEQLQEEQKMQREELATPNCETPNLGNSNPQTPDFSEWKKIIDVHFSNVIALVRYNKEKDANVLALSKQLQAYRDGFETTLFKRVALELITYRENCRKSIRESASTQLTISEALKYLDFLQQEYEDLLQNLGLENKNGEFLYNGKPLNEELEISEFRDAPQLGEEVSSGCAVTDMDSLISYLKNCEERLVKIVENNAVLDSLLADYIKISSIYERGLYQVALYPVLRRIIKIYQKLAERIKDDSEHPSSENANEIYLMELNFVVEQFDDVLPLCNVSIDEYVSDDYNPKKQRILKFIATDDAAQNGKVVCRYTDCYIMDDKTIYPSKVDIFKKK